MVCIKKRCTRRKMTYSNLNTQNANTLKEQYTSGSQSAAFLLLYLLYMWWFVRKQIHSLPLAFERTAHQPTTNRRDGPAPAAAGRSPPATCTSAHAAGCSMCLMEKKKKTKHKYYTPWKGIRKKTKKQKKQKTIIQKKNKEKKAKKENQCNAATITK